MHRLLTMRVIFVRILSCNQSGSREALLPPRPLGTARDTFASDRSSRSKAPW